MPYGAAYQTPDANAERIVACVNACEGINPEAVPEMLEALKKIAEANIDSHGGHAYVHSLVIAIAEQAIVKAESEE